MTWSTITGRVSLLVCTGGKYVADSCTIRLDQNDLKYCGSDSEREFYTTQDTSTKYDTECNINPVIDSDTIAYLPPNEDLTATCWTHGDVIIDDEQVPLPYLLTLHHTESI